MPMNLHSPQKIGSATNNLNLVYLILEWENLQREIEALSQSESHPLDPVTLLVNDEKEGRLQDRQNDILQKIIDWPCSSPNDMLTKLKFWQRSKLLGCLSYEEFSLTDQIALSIDLDTDESAG